MPQSKVVLEMDPLGKAEKRQRPLVPVSLISALEQALKSNTLALNTGLASGLAFRE